MASMGFEPSCPIEEYDDVGASKSPAAPVGSQRPHPPPEPPYNYHSTQHAGADRAILKDQYHFNNAFFHQMPEAGHDANIEPMLLSTSSMLSQGGVQDLAADPRQLASPPQRHAMGLFDPSCLSSNTPGLAFNVPIHCQDLRQSPDLDPVTRDLIDQQWPRPLQPEPPTAATHAMPASNGLPDNLVFEYPSDLPCWSPSENPFGSNPMEGGHAGACEIPNAALENLDGFCSEFAQEPIFSTENAMQEQGNHMQQFPQVSEGNGQHPHMTEACVPDVPSRSSLRQLCPSPGQRSSRYSRTSTYSQSGTQSRTQSPVNEARTAQDQFLLEKRAEGMAYKEIKQLGGFSEAVSTLRGRHRTLTKEKRDRVRKPEWTRRDIQLLKEAVDMLSGGEDAEDAKIPWTRVSEHIFDHGGSYKFGNATCHRRWAELRENSEI